MACLVQANVDSTAEKSTRRRSEIKFNVAYIKQLVLGAPMRSVICIVTAFAFLGLPHSGLFCIATQRSNTGNAGTRYYSGGHRQGHRSRSAADRSKLRIKGPAPRSTFEQLQDPAIFPMLSSAGQRAMLIRSGMPAQPRLQGTNLVPEDTPAPVLDQIV